MKTLRMRLLPVADRWCVHSYYTTCPYAPDGSGRILASGADLERGCGEVLVLSADGEVLHRFGEHGLNENFYHTGWWQTWSPDAQYIYYQAGTLSEPTIGRYHLESGNLEIMDGDMEGAPPSDEPIFSGLLGMLYAAGYGSGKYRPELSPIPFQQRDRHGVFEFRFCPVERSLRLSVAELLRDNCNREKLILADREIQARLGKDDGLTLMTYCLRWSPDSSRLVFFFGNHCVAKERDEPKIMQVITTSRTLQNRYVALDFSFEKQGVHWSWQSDNEHLIGYAMHPDRPGEQCLAEVRYDGTGFRVLSDHGSGGHPSVSPTNPDLIVTDENVPGGGAVVFLSKATGKQLARVPLPKHTGETESYSRDRFRVCHHPVFNRTGDRVLCNSLPGRHATLVEIEVPDELVGMDSRR